MLLTFLLPGCQDALVHCFPTREDLTHATHKRDHATCAHVTKWRNGTSHNISMSVQEFEHSMHRKGVRHD